MNKYIHVIGFDSSDKQLTVLQQALETSVAVVSSKRLYSELLKYDLIDTPPPRISYIPLVQCVESIGESLHDGDVTVLVSGDPFFFGIGSTLKKSFPDYTIYVHPTLSSMQLAFSRFSIAWNDATFVSLHGRNMDRLSPQLLVNKKTFVFTDPHNRPNVIAERLLVECDGDLLADVVVHVGENLGFESEQLSSGTLSEIASRSFIDPNVMIILTNKFSMETTSRFGLLEQEICHSRGLITKNEVRAATIHALRIPPQGVFWDVGAGSGSIGLEVARLFPDVRVFAIEKNEEELLNIKRNRKKFGVWNLECIQGTAPSILESLPFPDRVFVGGNGGELQGILELCTEKLAVDGLIVVNAVIAKTAEIAPKILHDLGFEVEIREINVSRFSYPAMEEQVFNPIKIIRAARRLSENRHFVQNRRIF